MEDISTSTNQIIEALNATRTVMLSNEQFATLNNSLHEIAATLQSQPFWETQIFAVLVGAIVGLLPTLYLLHNDRPKIRVDVNHILAPQGGRIRNGFSINIANSGRRAVHITRAFLRFRDGSSLIWQGDTTSVFGLDQLPMSLGEGKSHSVIIMTDAVAEAFYKKQEYPIAVCYADALGNEYRRKTKNSFWETLGKVSAND